MVKLVKSPQLTDDPNYLIVGIKEHNDASARLGERAGILLGVSTALSFILISMMASSQREVLYLAYHYGVPIFFGIITSALYFWAVIRTPILIPFEYMYSKALRDGAHPMNLETDLPNLQNMYKEAVHRYGNKYNHWLYANFFFVLFILETLIVNIFRYEYIVNDLKFDISLVIQILIIIGLILVQVLRKSNKGSMDEKLRAHFRFENN